MQSGKCETHENSFERSTACTQTFARNTQVELSWNEAFYDKHNSTYTQIRSIKCPYILQLLQMIAVSFNPYTWDNSSKAIQSNVVGLELKNDKAKINVSNLDEDIVIVVPISSPPKNGTNTSDVPEHSFLKPNKMVTRMYNAELADVPVSIKLDIVVAVVVEVFVKFGSKPTIDNFDHNFTVTFKSTCENKTDGEKNKTSCLPDEKSMTVVPPKPGLLYVGIFFLGAKNYTEHSRVRRSCFGHGRQRRSCVGFKDPPPKGVTKTVIPQYDPSTDVNYSMIITQSSCLYWSEDKEKWTSHGCKATISNSKYINLRDRRAHSL